MSDAPAPLQSRLSKAWPVLLPALAALWVFPYLPELRSPNELCRLHQTRALVDHGTFEINDVLRERGYVGDLSCVAVARDASGAVQERMPCPAVRGQPRFHEEHYYPSKAPLLSVAAVPIYWVLEKIRGGPSHVPEVPLVFFARFFLTVLPLVLMLIPLRRYLRASLEPRIADALTAAYGLGTLAFSYAELFMSHQTTAVFLFLTFFALWRTRRGDWKPTSGFLLAGLFAGLSVAAEYTAALALVPLAVYGVLTAPGGSKGKLQAAVFGVAGVIPSALALMAYHHSAFGSAFTSGYKFLNDAAYQGWHIHGFLGITLPDARAFVLSFFSPLRGLFALSPFLLLGVLGLFFMKKDDRARPELLLGAALLALYAYFTSSFTYDSWGWTTGPRHLTPLVPFLLLPAGRFMESARAKPWLSGLCGGLVGLSILTTSAMTFLNYIPDSLTNALYQVAWPFLASGHLPHSLASLIGIPNPWACVPALFAVIAAASMAMRSVLPETFDRTALVSAGIAVTLVVAIHASVKPIDEGGKQRDRGTYTFLEERYVPRPGEASPAFWKE